ncbi:MAG: DNA-3-methyladenine glycosylase I [Rhodospirillales bacterium]|nr:DNA-3-methyladenine glycosylase I [Rhodospirillales bacterium]
MDEGLIQGDDGLRRCWWCGDDPLYVRYHDEEWGRPVGDDTGLFEKICLEGFQAGLSWITILRKRENFRRAFAGFDFEKVARFTDKDVGRLMSDEGIIRHRGKIEAAINNAQKTCELIDDIGGLGKFFWRYEPQKHSSPKLRRDVQATSPESEAISKALKQRGFKFVGPTTMYAHMQAMGMVNDHLEGCDICAAVEDQRRRFQRP